MNSAETPSPPASPPPVRIGGKVLARNTLLNIIGRVLPLIVGIVAMPYVIRHLGPDRYGLLSLAWMVVGYFALFNLGIGPATTKFVAELLGKGELEKLPELVWTALISQTCLGAVGGVLLAVASPLLVNHVLKIPADLHPQAHLIFLILAVALPIDFAGGSMSGVLGASQRFDLLNAIGIPSSALTYLVPVVALALGFGLPSIVFFLVLARIAGFAVTTFLCMRLYPALRSGFRFNRRLVRSLLGYGGWVTVSDAVRPILVYFDRFLIGTLVSVAAIGFYTPPYMISTKLLIVPGGLTATLLPAFSTSAGRGDHEWIRSALIRSLKLLLLTVGPAALLLAFFARPLLTFWVGARFATEGSLALQIMALGALANGLASVPSNLIYGLGRPEVAAKLHLLEIPPYIALTWFLVSRFGLSGAAFAWTARMVFEFAIFITAACWLTRTPARSLANKGVRRGLGVLLALAAGLMILWMVTHAFVIDAIFTALLGGGFLLASWHYVLDVEEKWQIRIWLRIAT